MKGTRSEHEEVRRHSSARQHTVIPDARLQRERSDAIRDACIRITNWPRVTTPNGLRWRNGTKQFRRALTHVRSTRF
jgi:hypothetical protein